ncbi:MAG TPA: response regulator transcription factor [Armatimonadota bacterium]|nr:response regulator transcription factor [Armatimonadota bacterium]
MTGQDNSPNNPTEPESGRIRLMLVDDHAIWRGGVRSMLEDTQFEIVAEASSGPEAVEVARQIRPQMMLLDIRMAGGDGLDALQILKQEHREMAVIMLTTYDNPTYMARAVAGGAAGYLLKGIDREPFLEALVAVANGEMLLSPEELSRSLRGISKSAAVSTELYQPLSDRELDVLRLLATGLKNRDMANILFVAESTVKTHVEHIIQKLGVSDRVQAAVWAARHGLVETR